MMTILGYQVLTYPQSFASVFYQGPNQHFLPVVDNAIKIFLVKILPRILQVRFSLKVL